jgi:addiction module HigA family antidote
MMSPFIAPSELSYCLFMRMKSKSSITTRKRQSSSNLLPLITPGEILAEEFMQPLGLAANALALALRVPATRIQAILKGQRAISADTALRLAVISGTRPNSG